MIGVVLHYYGSPRTLADVRDFYPRIIHREPDAAAVARLVQQYRAYGRPAPLGATVERIERLLEERLNREASPASLGDGDAGDGERRFVVRRAGKDAPPWISDVISEMVEQGVTKIISLPLTPFGSKLGTENYHRAVHRALEENEAGRGNSSPDADVRVIPVDRWYLHDLFVRGSELRLRQALSWLPDDVRPGAAVVFTTHSMPRAEVGEEPPLPEQYRLWAEATARRAGLREWMISYRNAAWRRRKVARPRCAGRRS